jgi:hypothetical protein
MYWRMGDQGSGLNVQRGGEPGCGAAAAGQAGTAWVYRYGPAFDRLRSLALTAGKSAEFIATKTDNIK